MQYFLRLINPGAVMLIYIIIRHAINKWKSSSFTYQKFKAGANLNSNLSFLYSYFNYLGHTITNSNISRLGIDKGYIGRLVNRAPKPDFRAFITGRLKKTLSNYTQ